METYIIFSFIGICILPLLVVLGLPRKQEFFSKPVVRGFGLGVYTSLVFLLTRESVEHGGVASSFLWVGLGVFISVMIGLIFKEFHHHHVHTENDRPHTKGSMWRILLSDFFHNIVDGLAIASGFGLSAIAGGAAFIGVLGHQTIQQAGQQVLLVESGISPKKSIIFSLVISSSIFLSYFLRGNETIEAPLMALSAGIISWKIGTDILHTKWNSRMVFGFFIGVVILTTSLILIPHSH